MGTASEKAKELVDKYKGIEIGSEGFHSWGMSDWQAKEAAIICVDFASDYANSREELRELREIKNEIEKL